eukprot:14719909-Alexandrium_andersonii.AAC.1
MPADAMPKQRKGMQNYTVYAENGACFEVQLAQKLFRIKKVAVGFELPAKLNYTWAAAGSIAAAWGQ